MIRPLTRIARNDRSAAVGDLHFALEELGFPIPADERDERRAGPDTERAVRLLQGQLGIDADDGELLIDDFTAAALNVMLGSRGRLDDGQARRNSVAGVVRNAGGSPARGLLVTAYDQDMRKREVLGAARTDANGRYSIGYSSRLSAAAELGSADLVVEVTDASDKLLFASDTRFNSAPSAIINVTLPPTTASEFEAIEAALTQLVAGQDVTLASLEESEQVKDISFAAGETGFAHAALIDFAVAQRLGQDGKLPPPFWYAVLRSGAIAPGGILIAPAPDLGAMAKDAGQWLLEASPSDIEAGLGRAAGEKIIAASRQQITAWMRSLRDLQKQAGSERNAASAKLATMTGLKGAAKRALSAALAEASSSDETIARLKAGKAIPQAQLEPVEALLKANELLLGDTVLLRSVKDKLASTTDLPRLAARSADEWKASIKKSRARVPDFVAGETADEKLTNYARLLSLRLADAYPTAAFGGRLGAEPKPALSKATQIAAFIDSHPDFEFATTSVDGYLKKKAAAKFANEKRSGDFVQQLKAAQRVFKIAPSFEQSNSLLAGKLHSAGQVYRLGKRQFVALYKDQPGFDQESAAATFERAANTYGAVAKLVGDLKSLQYANLVQSTANSAAAINDLPDWSDLFQDSDACACEDCRSIFGPAAYLADLLKWLEGRKLTGAGPTAKDVLFSRRPDLGYIDLNCDNALVELPYVDLACEIMEELVAPSTLFNLPGGTAFAAGAITPALQTAFANAAPLDPSQPQVDLSADARVYGPDHYSAWIVRDGDATYLAAPSGGGFAVSILRQTHGPTEDRMAAPEYVNQAAYKALGSAVTPLSLPFDLNAESVRAYLGLANVTRAQLMEEFRGKAPANPSDLDIACEYLAINPGEANLILVADPNNQFKYWGKPDNPTAIADLSKVDGLLKATNLDFNALETLLSLSFVNPNNAITISNPKGSCDTADMSLQPLDAGTLDRLHRFLRLWRKLGWTMWEVDLVIGNAGLGNGTLDQNFALKLKPFLQLKERLGSFAVEPLAAFFDAINTTAKFVAAYTKRTPSLYEHLFLNPRLSKLSDPDFAIDKVSAATAELMSDHAPRILAACKIKAADLAVLTALAKPGAAPAPYIDGTLTLSNLSFIYRHSALARALGIKIADWKSLLLLLQQDPFADPATTLDFARTFDRLKASGLSIDQADYILTDERAAKAAAPAKTIATAFGTLKTSLQGIAASYDPSTLPADDDSLATLLIAQLQLLGWDSASAANAVAVLKDDVMLGSVAKTVAAVTFPAGLSASFDATSRKLYFSGIMSAADRNKLLTAVTPAAVQADASYISAVQELYDLPGLLVQRYDPSFTAPLESLAATVQFTSLDKDLAARINYDSALGRVSFFGVMTNAERDALLALPSDADFQNAVQLLYQAARNPPPAADTWIGNLGTATLASAARALTGFLQRKLSSDQVVQQVAGAFGLTQATALKLVTLYPRFGAAGTQSVMEALLDPAFAASNAAVTNDTFPKIVTAYYWLHRVALVLKTVAATNDDVSWIIETPAAKSILDFAAIPFSGANMAATSAAQFGDLLSLAELMAFHHGWSDGKISLLDIIDELIANAAYTTKDFAADAEALTGWLSSDVQALADSIDLAYPADYRTSKGWRRLDRAEAIIGQLSAGAAALFTLAGPSAGESEDEALRGILRSQYSDSDWLANNQVIQNGLRERKRDGLIAFLMAKGAPASAPNSPWTDPNDLFDCYLIDPQMCSCMPTTRIVQAYSAVQLFTQRCLMGLEPNARADVENDENWAQFEWMKFYRLWEANRQVFAFPENFVEPNLRKDKSALFSDLENALVQNGVTSDSAEQALLAYLDGLNDIAQLEIAGTYYQEDDERPVLHVFGRSPGGDPRIYYYRQYFPERYWTPWEKVDLDIKGDYLTPFVFNRRLYIVWLEFRDKPGEAQSAPIPSAGSSPVTLHNSDVAKEMSAYLAISELRNGVWTPKRVADAPFENDNTSDQSQFLVVPLDFTWLPQALSPSGPPKKGVPRNVQWMVDGQFLILVQNNATGAKTLFQMAGCRGYPEDFEGNLKIKPIVTSFINSTFLDAKDTANQLYPLTPTGTPAGTLTPKGGSFLPAVQILRNLPSQFKVTYPHYLSLIDRWLFLFNLQQTINSPKSQQSEIQVRGGINTMLGSFYDWFYADSRRTFHVRPELYRGRQPALYYEDLVQSARKLEPLIKTGQWQDFFGALRKNISGGFAYRLRFATFYHPLICTFISQLYQKGVDGLMARSNQFADAGLDFKVTYRPTIIVDPKYPDETAVFDDPAELYQHGYASYNWELFYFAPVMIAEQLSQNQQFEDAMRWYQYVFDPTGGHDTDPVTGNPAGAPQKYWITKPFYQHQSSDYQNQRLETLMSLLADDPSNPTDPTLLKLLQIEVANWRSDPFDPHVIARQRTVAYQKFVVMKYLDNVIAWADQQFTMDTMESVNIATQLYVLAAHILGKRPEIVPPPEKPAPETFNELDDQLDAFSNTIIQFENLLPPMPSQGGGSMPAANIPGMLYFCIPQNEKLLGYWDTIEDRLYKIRHCLNIEGVFSPPVLFPPPINPMDLIRATALGQDLSSALADLNAPLPHYRFSVMLQMANEITQDVKALGSSLLAALEKKDAEALALLRQGQEIALLKAVRAVKQKQIDDARIALEGLQKTQELTTQRFEYYSSREFMNPGETAAVGLNSASLVIDAAIAAGYILSGGLKLVPDFMLGLAGFGGSPTANAETGGNSFGNSAEDAVKTISSVAAALDKAAALASVVAGYQRRMDDWQFQARSASKELEQIAKQIEGANKKIEIAQTELANQDLQIGNAQAINSFMQGKYTNEELYQWQIGQISQTYFAAYGLARTVAKAAERCFRYELGLDDSAYIQSGYWNSLKSGLHAGEQLQLDLRRMEADYRAQNRREFECVKHVSLALTNPAALAALKSDGACTFELPEELFDLDFPGHYFRRIKSVSVSIPCVAGPYTTVAATLRLLKDSIRVSSSSSPAYERANDNGVLLDDPRFRDSSVRVDAIATSSAQNDSGMFELNFRDERYLPFELRGVISTMQLQMMEESELRQFSYDTISDVIVHIHYTAREDAGLLRQGAIGNLKKFISQTDPEPRLWRLFDLKREFPTEWYAMLHPAGGGSQVLNLAIGPQHFPFMAQDKAVHMISATLVTRNLKALSVMIDPPFDDTNPANGGTRIKIAKPAAPHVYAKGGIDGEDVTLDGSPWSISFLAAGSLADADIAECYLLIGYALQ